MSPDRTNTAATIASSLTPPDSRIELTGLRGSASSYLLAQLIDKTSSPLFVITPDSDSAEELYRELCFYCGDKEEVLIFPTWDGAPFEPVSTHPDTTGQRLGALFRLLDRRVKALVLPVAAALQKVLPRQTLGEVSQYLVSGEEVRREELLQKLVRLGYANVPIVEDRGSFSVRGGILDIFPPNLATPVRIEFFGDFVDTIRSFDPQTQRSLHTVSELVILPSKEIILTDETLAPFAIRLKERCDALDMPVERRRLLLEQLQSAIYPPGIEFLQPLFHPGLETIFAYAPPDTVMVLIDPATINANSEQFAAEIEKGFLNATGHDLITPDPEELYLSHQELALLLEKGRRVTIPYLTLVDGGGSAGKSCRIACEDNQELKVAITPEGEGVLLPLTERLSAWLAEEQKVVVVCQQVQQAQRLHELLLPYGVQLDVAERSFPRERVRRERRVAVLVGEISRGFRLAEEKLVVIAEEELFGKRVKRRGLSEARKKQLLSSLAELKPGDHMVHIDFGIGIYRGLQHLQLGDTAGDFILLEYADSDKLYLPVDRLNLVQRYVGAESIEPRVDKLGSAAWEKAKTKARAAVQEMAEELLKIYAMRQVQEGHSFSPPDELYREFEAAFAFEETPDQMAAINDVLEDLQNPRPMDRLVCGDVGYGKTEVAMRGAFKVVMDGKQVAILVPTTVLAQQHLESFRERFKPYPVTVEMLSRFRSTAEQKAILAGVAKGSIDIIIGTHRLLQKDVKFKELGLLIVDEEQRFGVTHKERLKQYKAVVDIMTLTATPIPRTLYMSIMGIRDLSIIDTPPVDRLAIKTHVARFDDELIREAVLRELRRGGQVFFVHNRVQSIAAMAEHLYRIVPEAKIAVAHGQMEEKELERVMLGFMHGETNLLLCTTIIESGLDIPTANTLIVNRADAFGLAQLYQLRGRVGRSRQRAYAYFLISGEGAITSDARERLKILQELTELGAGFRIATHDLEIRGAGDLLGAKQSGNIAAVGFELYTELLEETVRQMKGEEVVERVEPEIKLRIPAFIPEDYLPDPNQRLLIYKKLTQTTSDEELAEIRGEMTDRFGRLPQAALYLLDVMQLRLHMKQLLIKEAEYDGKRLVFSFHQKTPVSPDKIIAMIRQKPNLYRFTPDFSLIVELAENSFDGIIAATRNLLKTLV